jgi:dihydrofolate reductase/thymidylate synthase
MKIIAALDRNRGIGKDGTLPWRLKGDMSFFKTLTTTAPGGKTNAVIMGRKTWESIPAKFRPLPDRLNIVLSRELAEAEGAVVCDSFDDAHTFLAGMANLHEVYVIGGAGVYAEALKECDALYLTHVDIEVACDVFFPEYEHLFKGELQPATASEENGIRYTFETWTRA